MKHLIVLLLATFSFSTFGQTAYEKGMQSAMGLWSQGKNSEAIAMFERIAAAEKDNWLPNYYVALVKYHHCICNQRQNPNRCLAQKSTGSIGY
jgi:hypothetical protein